MQRTLIQLLNGTFLVIVLIGVPAVASIKMGGLQISSRAAWQTLTLYGLGAAAALNLIALLLARRSNQSLLGTWAAAFGALLLIQILIFRGTIHFLWLKQALLWLKKQAG
jgi:hypothetical protein